MEKPMAVRIVVHQSNRAPRIHGILKGVPCTCPIDSQARLFRGKAEEPKHSPYSTDEGLVSTAEK